MNTNHKDLIDPAAVGVEVSWSFGNGSSDAVKLSRAAIRAAFVEHGFGIHAPESELDVDDVLRRVQRLGTGVQAVAVRELARPRKDTPRCVGVYVRREIVQGAESERGDGWELVARVRGHASLGIVCMPPEGLGAFVDDALGQRGVTEGKRLAALANSLIDEVHNGDISRALVSAAQSCLCIARRPGGGGVYLLLRNAAAESFVALLQSIARMTVERDRSQRFAYQAQETYAKPLTTASWAESTEAQLTAEAHRLLGDLEAMVARGVMREKTMAARSAEAQQACELADAARIFLGDKTDELKAMLAKVQVAFDAAQQKDMEAADAALAAFPDPARKAKYAKPETAPAPAQALETPKPGRRELSVEELLMVG